MENYNEKEISKFANDLILAEKKSFIRDLNSSSGNGFQDYDEMAEILIKKGYHKIDANEVVLTKEQYEQMKNRPEQVYIELNERMKEELKIEKKMGEIKADKVRKETAKEILQDLMNYAFLRELDSDKKIIGVEAINMIAKKYGVEVEQ